MERIDDEEFEKYLKNKVCCGCSNHCLLLDPNCNRSKIFIKVEYDKYLESKEG